ncbi:Glycosyltransferase involved in cell wall bisynthesis [Ekhidna lutea]|uniref:Glycosyltransferase involved in cell wall bisynthesis n=1 Tax=Ekhidna lutea TaxID=447679 RepID=A0A239KGV8_EKHLU|nr:glycosyltransferase family 4 protein [Ekhidna lutea]SNT16928.1 Glycosyltransferase involved in cell wall bisynthesis [Ekhidna lutea]
MKIAFIANTCWNIYNFRKGLVHHFLSKGDEVIVLAPQDEYTAYLEDWGVRCILISLDSTGSNPVKDFSYFGKIHKIFRREKPDIALSYTIKSNIYSSLAGKFTSVPVICNVSGLGTVFLVEGLIGKLAVKLYKLAFRYSSYVFFQNEDDKNFFTSIIHLKDDRVGVLPGSGIDLNDFAPEEFKEAKPLKLLMISRVIIEKGVREYAEAASTFSDDDRVSFTLIGKFDQKHSRSITQNELDSWQRNGWIQYYSHSDEIKRIISAHDVVVLPSYREGTPRTLLEGAALAKPILTTDVPGCREVVKDGHNGFLFEAKNAKSLVDKIKLLLSLNDEERRQLGKNSRKLVEERFDENIVIDMYDQTIRRIIGLS